MEPTPRPSPTAGDEPTLRRSITLPWLVLYGLGTTIGAGIYALVGVVAGRAGMLAPWSFLVASLLALLTALSFAELSSRFPRAGGEAVYVHEATRSDRLATVVGVLVVLAGLISAATVSVAFVGYLGEFVSVPRGWTVLALVLAIGAVDAWGVRESVAAVGLMTLIEVGGLLAVIAIGADRLAELPARAPELWPTLAAWPGIGSAAVLSFYAYLGFEDMVNVAEEVKDVRRTLPRGILLTLAISVVLYTVLSTVAVLAVPPAELSASQAPLALVFERCGGPAGVLGVIALFALLNGALIQVIKAARVLFGLASQGLLPARFARVHPRTRTPLFATAVSTALAAGLAVSLPLEALAEATSLVTLATFTLAHVALWLVKRRGPAPPGSVTFPAAVPVAGAVACAAFILFELGQRWSALGAAG